jgi:hypothetical protein
MGQQHNTHKNDPSTTTRRTPFESGQEIWHLPPLRGEAFRPEGEEVEQATSFLQEISCDARLEG